MAHYVSIPKDLNDIKEKFMMGFTKRQVICFGIGLAVGAPVFFLTRSTVGMSGAIFEMGACAAPAILCGLYRKNGVFLEKQVRYIICVHILPDHESDIIRRITSLQRLREKSNIQRSEKSSGMLNPDLASLYRKEDNRNGL